MDFKRFQFLRERTREHVRAGDDRLPREAEALQQYHSLSLAYLGDAYYSLYVRTQLLATGLTQVRVLHDVVTSIICAKGQARAYLALENELTAAERAVAHRARNATLSIPRSAKPWEYRCSTALEALFGFLYLAGERERLDALCRRALLVALEEA